MKTNFFCPECKGFLCVGGKLIFSIRKKDSARGLLLLSPKLGEYHFENHSSFFIEEGEEVEFFCPICGFELTLDGHTHLVRIQMQVDDKETFWVVFSKKKGEKCTYKISGDGSKEVYGEHAQPNVDFRNLTLLK